MVESSEQASENELEQPGSGLGPATAQLSGKAACYGGRENSTKTLHLSLILAMQLWALSSWVINRGWGSIKYFRRPFQL